MTQVKICGLRRPIDAEMVNAAQADYAGVILAKGFRRTIDEQTAASIRATLDAAIPLVGVFVNDEVDAICKLLNDGVIDVAQLHGTEDAAKVRAIQMRTNKPVWKVFKVNTETDFNLIEESPADAVLLDAGTGSGETFDWSLATKVKRPIILAGGLHSDNVAQAIHQVHPQVVDVSSGTETEGVKDVNKIQAFVKAVRHA